MFFLSGGNLKNVSPDGAFFSELTMELQNPEIICDIKKMSQHVLSLCGTKAFKILLVPSN